MYTVLFRRRFLQLDISKTDFGVRNTSIKPILYTCRKNPNNFTFCDNLSYLLTRVTVRSGIFQPFLVTRCRRYRFQTSESILVEYPRQTERYSQGFLRWIRKKLSIKRETRDFLKWWMVIKFNCKPIYIFKTLKS